MNGVSIIVCCYNSASRLPKTLEYLAKQVVPDFIPWEVVLVDNASTDNTKEVAISEWEKYALSKVQLRLVNQPKPGLTYAREKGISESKYDVVIFCDDDNWLSENYVFRVHSILKNNPQVGVVGGCGEEVCEVSPPGWFEDLKGGFAVGKQASFSGYIFERSYVYGAGSGFRKSVFNELFNLGFRSLLSDRQGNFLSSGGDGELCLAFQLRGYKLYYDDQLKFKHFISKEKLTLGYVTKMFVGFSASQPILNLYEYANKGIHINKAASSLRFLWYKDFIYSIYLIKNLIGGSTLRFKMYFGYLKNLCLLRKVYLKIYFQILTLKL